MRESAALASFFRAPAGAPAGAGWLSVGRVGTSGPVGRGPGRRVRGKLESSARPLALGAGGNRGRPICWRQGASRNWACAVARAGQREKGGRDRDAAAFYPCRSGWCVCVSNLHRICRRAAVLLLVAVRIWIRLRFEDSDLRHAELRGASD